MTQKPEVLLLGGLIIVLLAVIVLGAVLWPRGRKHALTSDPDSASTLNHIGPWVMEARGLFALWEGRIERLDELKNRLGGMAEEIERLRAEIGHIDEMRAQITRLGNECERCRGERDHLREVVARIASLAHEAAAKPSE